MWFKWVGASPAFATKSRCAMTARTSRGSGALNRTRGCPDGSRVQGSELSVSVVSLSRAPTTSPFRVASRATLSTVAGSTRGCSERNFH